MSSPWHLGSQSREQTSELLPRLGNMWQNGAQWGVWGLANRRPDGQAAAAPPNMTTGRRQPILERWALHSGAGAQTRVSHGHSLHPSMGLPDGSDLPEDVDQFGVVRAKIRFSFS